MGEGKNFKISTELLDRVITLVYARKSKGETKLTIKSWIEAAILEKFLREGIKDEET